MDLAGRLARYVLSLDYSKIDPKAVHEMKARVVDALGCAIGAFDEGPVAMARSFAAKTTGEGPSTILGTPRSSSPPISTFVNGLMIRYFDFNDTYLSKEPAHPSDNLAPCLAVS